MLILVTALTGAVLWFRLSRCYPQYWQYGVAPLSWLLHVSLFHAARLLDIPIGVQELNQWSIAIHLHALILLAAAPVVLCYAGARKDE